MPLDDEEPGAGGEDWKADKAEYDRQSKRSTCYRCGAKGLHRVTAFDGPIVIPPGATWVTRFRATGPGGSASITAAHAGGVSGLADPAPASLAINAPLADPPADANYFSVALVGPPSDFTPSPYGNHPFADSAKVGKAQFIYARMALTEPQHSGCYQVIVILAGFAQDPSTKLIVARSMKQGTASEAWKQDDSHADSIIRRKPLL